MKKDSTHLKKDKMNNQAGRTFIGTSGWQYKHWRSTFFPEKLKVKDQFSYYRSQFKTVELNASFYHMPAKKTFENWGKLVEKGFIFSVKANRFMTHLKKLNVDKRDVDDFLDKIQALKSHLGPILFQLPPRWHIDLQRLERFLKMLPKSQRYTFEFRDDTWYEPELYALLEKYNAAFCIYDLGGHQSPSIVSASFVYMRLHGPGAKYEGSYKPAYLKKLALKIKNYLKQNRDVYVYFDNDQKGFAPNNAAALKKLLAEHGNH